MYSGTKGKVGLQLMELFKPIQAAARRPGSSRRCSGRPSTAPDTWERQRQGKRPSGVIIYSMTSFSIMTCCPLDHACNQHIASHTCLLDVTIVRQHLVVLAPQHLLALLLSEGASEAVHTTLLCSVMQNSVGDGCEVRRPRIAAGLPVTC